MCQPESSIVHNQSINLGFSLLGLTWLDFYHWVKKLKELFSFHFFREQITNKHLKTLLYCPCQLVSHPSSQHSCSHFPFYQPSYKREDKGNLSHTRRFCWLGSVDVVVRQPPPMFAKVPNEITCLFMQIEQFSPLNIISAPLPSPMAVVTTAITHCSPRIGVEDNFLIFYFIVIASLYYFIMLLILLGTLLYSLQLLIICHLNLEFIIFYCIAYNYYLALYFYIAIIKLQFGNYFLIYNILHFLLSILIQVNTLQDRHKYLSL